MRKPWEQAIRQLVRDLVDGKYSAIATDGRIGRLSESELRGAIEDYNCTLVELPEDAFALADVVPVDGEQDAAAVDIPLWTLEEGRSDLTLSLTVRGDGDVVAISIDDLHVL